MSSHTDTAGHTKAFYLPVMGPWGESQSAPARGRFETRPLGPQSNGGGGGGSSPYIGGGGSSTKTTPPRVGSPMGLIWRYARQYTLHVTLFTNTYTRSGITTKQNTLYHKRTLMVYI